jgi:uncharacterized protein YxeA
MKKLTLTIFILIMTVFVAAAQNGMLTEQRSIIQNDFNYKLGNSNQPKNIEGSFYHFTRWNPVTFYIYRMEAPFDGYYGRYNIHLNEFEIMTQQGVKVISGTRVKGYLLKDSLTNKPHSFVNVKEFTVEGPELTGFFELLTTGTSQVAKRTYQTTRKPDYDPVTRTGNTNYVVVTDTELFFINDTRAYKIKGKKKLLAYFGEHAKEMEGYIKENSLSMNENDICTIVNHYNEISKKN